MVERKHDFIPLSFHKLPPQLAIETPIRGVTKNDGTRGGISRRHPLSAKIYVKSKNKKGLRCKTSWFSVRKYVMTKKKKKKVFAYRSVGFRSQKKKKQTNGSPTPSDATDTNGKI